MSEYLITKQGIAEAAKEIYQKRRLEDFPEKFIAEIIAAQCQAPPPQPDDVAYCRCPAPKQPTASYSAVCAICSKEIMGTGAAPLPDPKECQALLQEAIDLLVDVHATVIADDGTCLKCLADPHSPGCVMERVEQFILKLDGEASPAPDERTPPRVLPPRSRPIDNTCPDCGHIHQDESECGENIGAGRTCRCERRVMA